MHTVYIIENTSGKIYIGYTQNLARRIRSHNYVKGADWTQGKGPWKVIYTEEFSCQSDALKREKKLKSLKAGQRIKTILNINDTTSRVPR